LVEKSARDGLRENRSFEQLKAATKLVIAKLEEKRFAFRKKAGLSRPVLKIERELERLFAFEELKRGVQARLTQGRIDRQAAEEIIGIISKEEEEKNKIAESIRQTVAIYQGQATLGKIVNVILHEGRRPLNFFKNQIPNLKYWFEQFRASRSSNALEQLMPIAESVGKNAEIFVSLFSRLDPLAAAKRSPKMSVTLKHVISSALAVFASEIRSHDIALSISGRDDFKYLCWEQDFYAIFTNLVDNSIYWLRQMPPPSRSISILIETTGDALQFIDYRDSGPGIEPSLIESGAIFEPEFSTKPAGEGMGIGLAISGEAATRNGLELQALQSNNGAYFRLQPKSEVKDDSVQITDS
ncbi:MAG TPA: HAMP domain-containing sensor histidine kinase, partial [Verrucomicrobiae bacterium]|nr:HAMP domain-containing sensor histidine kinase [Verrucomicrobiae bacterium]